MIKNETKIELLDEINDKIQHKIGSIKETRIDGILFLKQIWTGLKWDSVCRRKDCKSAIGGTPSNGLCDKHAKEQLETNVVGEIIRRGTDRYKWGGKPAKWKLVCSVETCTKNAILTKGKRCGEHHKMHENGVIVSHASAVNIFNSIKENFHVERIKMRKNLENKKTKKVPKKE